MAYHRTKDELRRDRARIAHLYLRGESQYEIARLLNEETEEDGTPVREEYEMTQSKVSNDLKRVRERWEDSALMDFHQRRAEELARIDHLEQTYWDAWERSQDDFEEREVRGAPSDDGSLSPSQVKRKERERDGNATYLKGIQWCIEKRCELLGLDAPEWSMDIDIPWEDLSDEQLDEIAEGRDPRHVIESGHENGVAK